MNQLSFEKRAAVIATLVEGNSMRSVVRMTGVAKNTVAKLLVEVGAACARYQDGALRNLPCKRVQCDGIWSFCYAKDKNLPQDKKEVFGHGSVWTWTALDADTRLIASWMVGDRGAGAATEFIQDLAARLANRVQLTTDGHKVYVSAVEEDGSGSDIDYAMLVKIYGEERAEEARYSRMVCMQMRRFTRLTDAFSKKLENHIAAISLHFMFYNFCRIHQPLRISPAMAAGITNHVWEISEVLALLDDGRIKRADEIAEGRDW